MSKHIYNNVDDLLKALADFIVHTSRAAIQDHGRFSFLLSGGSSPKKLYQLLATEPYRSQIDWEKVFFFFGDERYVPLDHQDSNYRMAKETLFDVLEIPSQNIFPVQTQLKPEEAAEAYEKDIEEYFKHQPLKFDCVLLGLGDNSHTASLFPHTNVLHETDHLVKEVWVEEVNMYRITVTAPVINAGRAIAFLVFGSGKADAVKAVIEGKRDIENHPAQLIVDTDHNLHWYLDATAATKLSSNKLSATS
jgi:6-phosphogluconolactonase